MNLFLKPNRPGNDLLKHFVITIKIKKIAKPADNIAILAETG